MRFRTIKYLGVVALLLGIATAQLPARSEAQAVDYAREVRPIFAEHCTLCHGPDEANRQAELYLDHPESLLDVVEPGEPEASMLMLRVGSENRRLRMPPVEHGPALTASQIDTIRRWIEEGARWAPHWAYAPFRQVTVPDLEEAQPGASDHAIDRFVRARLEREGIAPSPPASRRELVRRLSLDLVGMPPTPEEVRDFLADDREDAYERLVDRLVGSPHYAERWARHWLDLARYADSNGYTIDGRRSMWPYRDWVIRAIERDMPFDQFTIEQLAGDLLPDPQNAQLVATGFHRNTQINQEGGAKDEENRINAVIDRVNTTGAVWLGSTLGCAQCHTHKFDPVSHVDYFRMFAFFDQTADGGVSSGPFVEVTDEESEPRLARFLDQRREFEAELAEAEREAGAGWVTWRPTVLTASEGPELRIAKDGSIRSVAHNPQTSLYDLVGLAPVAGIRAIRVEALPDLALRSHGPGRAKDGSFVVSKVRFSARPVGTEESFRELAFSREQPWKVLSPDGEPQVAVFPLSGPLSGDQEIHLEIVQDHGQNHVLGRFRVSFAPGDDEGAVPPGVVTERWRVAWEALAQHEARRPELPTSLVMQAQVPARTTHLLERGDFQSPGQVVTPGVPPVMNRFLTSGEAEVQPTTRLDLARWLVHEDNALVHRVTVNRWWQRFFGLGLVETENDFGIRGATPSHPELLEWIAAQLPARGFSMKEIHRLIVTSQTYRQSSAARPDLRQRDPRNRLLARQSRLRLDAESIRDSALRASGLLTPTVGGPPAQPPQPEGVFSFTQTNKRWVADEGEDRFRRSLYVRLWRSSPYPFLTTFDAPQPTVACTRRIPSSTPLQALTLANDPMILELAEGLGRRVMKVPGTDQERLERAFELALARLPREKEAEVMLAYLRREMDRTPDDPNAAWAAVARVLFNTEEFSHRN